MKLAATGAVSHLHSTPAMAERLLAGGLAAGVTVLAGGDHLATSALWDRAGDHGRLIRLAEADELVGCVALDGKPAAGLEVRVADTSLRPLAMGVAGELCVSGVGLADRFYADPAYTAERFVPDPLSRSGSRLYRTGQLARFTSDGTLEHLGPIPQDAPGSRRLAELYRTRELLGAQPSVLGSFVLPRPSVPHGKQLIGYIHTVSGAALDEDEVRRALARGWLPQQLTPDVLIQVNEWPLDERGAIDADRLPEPGDAPDQVATTQAPWDELFGTLLQRALDRVGYQGELAPDEPLSNFGLDSFGTVGLLLTIEQAYDITIPDDLQITEIVRTPRTLWETVAALCLEPLTG
jgi:acyl carrier protein